MGRHRPTTTSPCEAWRSGTRPGLPLVLDSLDLTIPAGGSLGIVGPSGAGKSTLVELLLRFREYDAGSIAIGGQDIRLSTSDEVRALMSVVPQDVHLFNATIRDNLALGLADATDEQMVDACRMAQVHDFIDVAARRVCDPCRRGRGPPERWRAPAPGRSPAPCSRTRPSSSSTRPPQTLTRRPRSD